MSLLYGLGDVLTTSHASPSTKEGALAAHLCTTPPTPPQHLTATEREYEEKERRKESPANRLRTTTLISHLLNRSRHQRNFSNNLFSSFFSFTTRVNSFDAFASRAPPYRGPHRSAPTPPSPPQCEGGRKIYSKRRASAASKLDSSIILVTIRPSSRNHRHLQKLPQFRGLPSAQEPCTRNEHSPLSY